MTSRPPLLSVCIPTFNRANLLESALYSLAPQVKATYPDVELVVSDNCSTDDTCEVVERARSWGPIRYYCNPRNEGFARNLMRLTNELARGEFAWVLGDDDLVRPGGIERILAVLKAHPEVDYVFVNCSVKYSKDRRSLGGLVLGSDFPELLPTKGRNLEDRYVERWEELIDPAVDDVFLSSLMVSVFRLAYWRMHRLVLANAGHFSSLEETYPHSVILAHTMYGRRAYYIGYPCAITFWGDQEWQGYLPLICTVRIQELLDLYLQIGVDAQRVEKCRRALVARYSGGQLIRMLLDPNTPGRQYFSLRKYLLRNRRHCLTLARSLEEYAAHGMLTAIRRCRDFFLTALSQQVTNETK